MKKLLLTTLSVLLVVSLWVAVQLVDIPSALTAHKNDYQRLIITHANVVTMARGKQEVLMDHNVVIENGTIVAIFDALYTPINHNLFDNKEIVTKTIEGKGRYLLPGLIDAHVHISDEAELAGYLSYGVTAVRNMSGYPFHLRLKRQIAQGELLAPDFITTGPTLNSPGANTTPIQQLVTTKSQAKAAVKQQHQSGFTLVKVYSNLTAEAFEGVLEETQKRGMAITGHSPEGIRTAQIPYEAPFDVAWESSVGKGFQTLEHTETLIWHALRDNLDLQRIAPLATKLKNGGDVLVPTLIAYRRLVNIAETQGKYLSHPDADTINPLVTLINKGAIDYWSHVDAKDYERPHSDFYVTATGLLHQYGVPMLVGTDAGGFGVIPGYSMLEEINLLHEAGLSPFEVLNSATRLSAQTLGFEKTGQVKVGYKANLLLTADNPLENMDTLSALEGVVKNGAWLDKTQLASLRTSAKETSLTRSLVRAVELLIYKL
ncbi:amidohydrolase family protein [Alteromonas sp. D210916BOD_24]|uniref:amidohydrolase family protein n=1 Tax=Alteromonas sp. D210916BOD_24 TaxID=3157618 RepID=UPI00399D19E4